MDLRGDLKTIRNGVFGHDSDSKIDVTSDFGCHEGCSSDQCAVCLEKQCNTLLLPCSHQFHAQCIIQWTQRQFSCPLCRSEISHFVPLRECNSSLKTDFARIWENHYITPPKEPEDVLIKHKPSETFTRGSLKRTTSSPSLLLSKTALRCEECSESINDAFIYFAFDHKFCSTPCRLKYARGNKNEKTSRAEDEGTNKFYVDHSQIQRYLRSERRPIPVRI